MTASECPSTCTSADLPEDLDRIQVSSQLTPSTLPCSQCSIASRQLHFPIATGKARSTNTPNHSGGRLSRYLVMSLAHCCAKISSLFRTSDSTVLEKKKKRFASDTQASITSERVRSSSGLTERTGLLMRLCRPSKV